MPLSEKQLRSIHDATHAYNIWVGAVGSGKTYASVWALFDLLKNGPQGDVMIIGVSLESVGRNVLGDLFNIIGGTKPSDKTTKIKIYGRDVYLVGANNDGAVRRIQGSNLAFAYVDEIACIPYSFIRMLEGRLRLPGARLLATCNPEGPNHWLKKEFIDRGINGTKELDLIDWRFLMDDNPGLDPAFKQRLKSSYSGMWYKRMILGEWAVSHGLIYDAYDHLNEYSDPIDSANYYIVGVDYGTSNATAAVLCAITPNKWPQIHVVQEYYYDSVKKGRQKTDDELASDIVDLCAYHNVRCVYVDPSAASLKAELRSRNIPVLDAKNDVIEGIKVTSKFVANKNLLIHKSCTTLIETMQSYSWDPKAADRGEDKPLKKSEHICDALRYAMYSAFPHGLFSHPDENITIQQLRQQVYGDQMTDLMGNPGTGGYF